MYAIITTGGKQYKVAKGDVFDVEKLDAQPGDEVKLDVLMLNDGPRRLRQACQEEGYLQGCRPAQGRQAARLQVPEA